jgi:hypothetical protein
VLVELPAQLIAMPGRAELLWAPEPERPSHGKETKPFLPRTRISHLLATFVIPDLSLPVLNLTSNEA